MKKNKAIEAINAAAASGVLKHNASEFAGSYAPLAAKPQIFPEEMRKFVQINGAKERKVTVYTQGGVENGLVYMLITVANNADYFFPAVVDNTVHEIESLTYTFESFEEGIQMPLTLRVLIDGEEFHGNLPEGVEITLKNKFEEIKIQEGEKHEISVRLSKTVIETRTRGIYKFKSYSIPDMELERSVLSENPTYEIPFTIPVWDGIPINVNIAITN